MLPKSEFVLLWGLVLVIVCHGSPINRQAGGQNTLRLDTRNQSYTEQNVCVNDDVLYQPGDLMPAPNPCSRCVCSPPGSQCMPVACEKKPGCKALLRPNQCCPEYQCECERNGRVYQNGERLDNAENPCEACYCQGGEVVCTTVECYKRDDCEPQYVKGKCCPKYDHCPPLAMDDARLSGQPTAEKTRPHHTRSTFQPDAAAGSAGAEAIDQAIDASNVQERIHVPETVAADATATPGDKPTTSPASDSTQEHVQTPRLDHHTEEVPVTNKPSSLADDEERVVPTIKIEVPAIPWTETPNEATDKPQKSEPSPADQHDGSGDDETQTVVSSDDQGSGMAETEIPIIKTQDEGMIGVIEHTTESIQMDSGTLPSTTDQMSMEGTTNGQDVVEVKMLSDDVNNDEADEKTERTVDITDATEQEIESTTFSSEYTGIPEEMITTPEPVSQQRDVTEVHGVDLSTEALLHATMPPNEHSVESSTDSSPEFKDFDEWSGTKSSEFQRDSSSVSSSSSSSSSDSHLKHSEISSDESLSHVLATNINSEKVKLTLQSEGNSALGSSSQVSTTSEESDSTEGSATTEISDSDASENTQKQHAEEHKNVITRTSNAQETIPINVEKNEGKHKIEEKATNNGQLNIVLDTEATDENGPPILLIGDELANHQMDIVVATVPSLHPESVTEISSKVKPDSRIEEKAPKGEQKTQLEVLESSTTTENILDTTVIADTSNGEDVVIVKGNALESQTEDILDLDTTTVSAAGITESDADITTQKISEPNTEKTLSYAAHDEMMLSDDPLPGQIASSETVNDNLGAVFGKTEQKIKKDAETEKHYEIKGDVTDSTITTTLSVADTTESSNEMKITDLQTESPDRESTTNTVAREEVGTTQDSDYQTTISNTGHALNAMSNDDQGLTVEKVSDRRADVFDEAITESATGNPATNANIESETTVIYDTTENSKVDENVPSILDEKQNAQNIKETQEEGKNTDLLTNTKNADPNQSNENPPEDVTATTSVEDTPTTENSALSKADKVKDFAHEEILLGDQPQTIDSSLHLPSSLDALEKQKNEEEKGNNEALVEDKTEMNLESAIIHEEIHNSESDEELEGTQNIEEQNIDTVNRPVDQEEVTERNSAIQKDSQEPTKPMMVLKNDNIHDVEQDSSNSNKELEIKADKGNREENAPTLVESSVIPKLSNSEELATPPPDTTLADANDNAEGATTPVSIQVKTAQPKEEHSQEKEKIPETTTFETFTEQQTDAMMTEMVQDTTEKVYKINPEILELKPIISTPASNTTEMQHESDITTLPPQWLKNENETKIEASNKDKIEEQTAVETTEGEAQEATVQPTERAEEVTENAPAVTTLQSLVLGGAGKQQPDEKKAIEEADKKDLFILEDFFTKLYRHQIATDATKH